MHTDLVYIVVVRWSSFDNFGNMNWSWRLNSEAEGDLIDRCSLVVFLVGLFAQILTYLKLISSQNSSATRICA